MIEVPRPVARACRAVFRRRAGRRGGQPPPVVTFLAGTDGLRVRLAGADVSVEYHQPGPLPPEELLLPLEVLDDFGGRGTEPVTLERVNGQVRARWPEAGVPQEVEYAAPDPANLPPFPEGPTGRPAHNPPELLRALDEAARSTATEGVRYAVQRVLLRGRSGEVVATDGRQLLVQGGFIFPWKEDVLVPRLLACSCKELAGPEVVEVGKAEQHVLVRAGPWSFFLRIDSDARYPRVENVIPAATAGATRWRIDPEDAACLAKALPRLPGDEDEFSPVTVDLDGGRVAVRGRAASGGRATEVVLARSPYAGRPVRSG